MNHALKVALWLFVALILFISLTIAMQTPTPDKIVQETSKRVVYQVDYEKRTTLSDGRVLGLRYEYSVCSLLNADLEINDEFTAPLKDVDPTYWWLESIELAPGAYAFERRTLLTREERAGIEERERVFELNAYSITNTKESCNEIRH